MGSLKRHFLAQQQLPPLDRQAAPASLPLGRLAKRAGLVLCLCNRCRHHAELAAAMLAGRLGPNMPVADAGTYMTCTSCGCRDVTTRPFV